MKKVFRIELFVKSFTKNEMGIEYLARTMYDVAVCGFDHWAIKLNGKEVIDGQINGFYIDDEWCEEIDG